jgi:ABC-type multidrug transport system ATPase subunit
MELAFSDITRTVNVKPVSKQVKGDGSEETSSTPAKVILSNVSGKCEIGRLQAIMGPSGAGKTTLLDILAGRRAQNAGKLMLNGETASAPMIRKHAAYVQQDDAIMASQTAREAVQMAALLTLPREMSRASKLERAEKVLADFQLDGCADTPVGDPVGRMKGLSGGERKRCAVAMAAVREPKILFLDEPTSGLDAYKALLLVQLLKNLAKSKPSTVIFSVHQPSSDIFALFDDLLLLLAGQAVFNSTASEAVAHFGTAGYPCPQYANPADFLFMHVLTTEDGNAAQGKRLTQLVDGWAASPLRSQKQLAGAAAAKASEGSPRPPVIDSDKVPGFATAFPVLLKRGLNDLKRNKMRGRAPFGQAIAMSMILGLIWFQISTDQKGVQDRVGVIFFMCVNGIMQNVMSVLTTFANERGAVLREQENGLYTTAPYFCARVLVDFPLRIICPFIFATLTYWMVGMQADLEKYLIFVVFNILLALSGNAMGLFVACIFPDVTIALAVAPIFLMPLIMFSGFVLNTDSIPVYFTWLEWLSPPKYAFAAIAQTEFDGLRMTCTEEQWRNSVTETGSFSRVCPFTSGEAFLETLNIQDFLSVTNCGLFLIGLIFVFKCFAFLALLSLSRKASAQASG